MKSRVLTALVGIPLVLAVVGCTNPWPLGVALLLGITVGSIELVKLLGANPPVVILSTAVILPVLSGASKLVPQGNYGWLIVLSFFLFSMAVCWLTSRSKSHNFYGAWVSCYWIGIPLAMLQVMHSPRQTAAAGWNLPNPILIVLLPVWAGDIAAMLGGMAFGKHPMAPKISPKKTWEGAICNFIAATLVGWGIGAWLGYKPWVGPACGVAVGIFGQLGDLFESALKRATGKKDSGNLLPGHGGLLDRIDALLGSVIPVWIILYLSGCIR